VRFGARARHAVKLRRVFLVQFAALERRVPLTGIFIAFAGVRHFFGCYVVLMRMTVAMTAIVV
jgi:hypothetical protein